MNSKTIKNLVKNSDNKVYVYLANGDIGSRFLRQAESEGFTFGDGAKPTSRHYARVMAVNGDMTINYVGAVGMMAFGSGTKTVGGKNFVKIDYEKYLTEEQ